MGLIALVNQKGGCMKSTTSVHLVRWLESQGRNVALVDADAQRSSSIWLESMESPTTVHVLQSPDDLLEQLPEIASQHDHTIVDGPAGLSEATRAILFRADLAVVPCQPTGVDLRSAADAIKLVRQAQSVRNGPPVAAVFLARAALLEQTQVPILRTVVHQKQVVADTFGQQATVWDLPGRAASESASEFEQLFKAVIEMLP
jgi:chromosome partitioning protein